MATGDDLAGWCLRQEGKPYVLGTVGPQTFDCSGLVWAGYQAVTGETLKHELRDSHLQFTWGDEVRGAERDRPRRGDLVFFDTGISERLGNRASHVGVALGDGRFVHAANPAVGVIVSDLAHYRRQYGNLGVRRVLPTGTGRTPPVEDRQPGRGPAGPIEAPNTWNGGPYGVDWSLPLRVAPNVVAAAREFGIDPGVLLRVVVIETQGLHERDGSVIERWDADRAHGPSVGVTQIKPRIWGWLLPGVDAWTLDGNLRLAAATLAHLVAEEGTVERALGRWFPGADPNGTTPGSYLGTFRALGGELGGWPGDEEGAGDAGDVGAGGAGGRAGAGGGAIAEGGRAAGAVRRRRRRRGGRAAGGAGGSGAAG